jgi:hypothetical protein
MGGFVGEKWDRGFWWAEGLKARGLEGVVG